VAAASAAAKNQDASSAKRLARSGAPGGGKSVQKSAAFGLLAWRNICASAQRRAGAWRHAWRISIGGDLAATLSRRQRNAFVGGG
jgi:hypothetical protein